MRRNRKRDDLQQPNNRLIEQKKIKKQSNKLKDANQKIKILRITLVFMLLVLILLYFILRIVYDTGRFTVILDSMSDVEAMIIMYEREGVKTSRRKLSANALDFMTNISGAWIPEDVDSGSTGGSHNGDNYIAYTFYIENAGDEILHYWYEIQIDDIIKDVDEAIRVAVYLNGNKTVYAKPNKRTSQPEKDTIAFKNNEKVMLEQRQLFQPGEVDKFTIVIWIEGDDPECIDDLIGGEMKMHMVITEEHIEQK